MQLRSQKAGYQKPWTLQELSSGLEYFHKVHKRYPTATEVDGYHYLPSARSIERRFGGLVALRKQLGLGDNHDFRTGDHSSRRAHRINKRAHGNEHAVYEFLTKRFGKEFVHREYFFTDDHRTRADFFVYDSRKGFCVDVFYPGSVRNLTGCLNIKLIKYSDSSHVLQYPVIFLQMNPEILQERLDALIKAKKKPFSTGQYLMAWETFKKFCTSRNPLQVLQERTARRRVGIPNAV